MYRQLPRIVAVDVYRRDVVVEREGGSVSSGRGIREEITEFSYKSRQRLAFVAANTDVKFVTMVTLTYPALFPGDGRKVKAHLHAFLEWLRRDIGASPYYLWFLEFQQRGAPHYHILIDWPLPSSREMLKAFRFRVSSSWYRIVGSGDVNHLVAGTRTERIRKADGAARYGVKYALKMRQKKVPTNYRNVGRFWGCSREVVPRRVQRHRVTEDDVRGALHDWKYAPSADRAVYQVLYGVADRFTR